MLTGQQIAEHCERIDRDGYTIVEGVVSSAIREELIQALLRVERDQDIGFAKTSFEGTRTVRIYNLLAHDPAFWQVPLNECVLPIAEKVLDRELLLSSLSAITLAPGQEAQPIHEDTQQIPLPRPHAPIAINALWALTDFTEENGATRIIPGSHRYDSPPAYGGIYDTIAAEMPAGSVMIFDSQLWHAGGSNRTDQRRFSMSCYYCAGWLRQQENLQLGIPREVAATFPQRLQELCGYSVYKGQYGHIDNQDPITLLGRTPSRGMVWEASDRKKAKRPA